MKYMTPELLARVRSEDDDVAEVAAKEWESRGEQYRARLAELRRRRDLPKGVRRLLKQDVLHDAKVLTMTADERNHVSFFIELPWETDPGKKHFELRYRLAGGVKECFTLETHPSLAGDGRPFGWWLYDELDVVTEGKLEAFSHSVLLTGGCEIQLTFHSLAWMRLDFFLLPTNSEGVVDPKEVLRLWEERHPKSACP